MTHFSEVRVSAGVPEGFQGGGANRTKGAFYLVSLSFFADISTIKALRIWGTLVPLMHKAAGANAPSGLPLASDVDQTA